jgi:hypothetical protein
MKNQTTETTTTFTWEQLYSDLLNITKSKGISEQDAQDYVQEAIMLNLNKIDTAQKYKSIKSYMSQAVTFIIRDSLRRNKIVNDGRASDIESVSIQELLNTDPRLAIVEDNFMLDIMYEKGSNVCRKFIDSYRKDEDKHILLSTNVIEMAKYLHTTVEQLVNMTEVLENNIL